MSNLADLHEEWSRDPKYLEAYEKLGPEFESSRSVIEARTNAGLTQAQLAERMKTARSSLDSKAAARIPRQRRWRRSRWRPAPSFESALIRRDSHLPVHPPATHGTQRSLELASWRRRIAVPSTPRHA